MDKTTSKMNKNCNHDDSGYRTQGSLLLRSLSCDHILVLYICHMFLY
jgi:hypothetical protein